VISQVWGDLQMVSKHQLAKHQDYVAAIGTIALEVVDLELELSIFVGANLDGDAKGERRST
jgi:hypothetical protein